MRCDEVHTQHLSEEEESEYSRPNTAVEQNGTDSLELPCLGVPQSQCSETDEGDRVTEISYHESEEEWEEYCDDCRRIDFLVLRYRNQFGRVLETFSDRSVLHLGRCFLETGFLFGFLVKRPASGFFFNFNINAVIHCLVDLGDNTVDVI